MPSDRVKRFLRRINEAEPDWDCAACGERQWDFAEAPITVPVPSIAPDAGFEAYPIMCQHCGLVRLYSTQHLEGSPKKTTVRRSDLQ